MFSGSRGGGIYWRPFYGEGGFPWGGSSGASPVLGGGWAGAGGGGRVCGRLTPTAPGRTAPGALQPPAVQRRCRRRPRGRGGKRGFRRPRKPPGKPRR